MIGNGHQLAQFVAHAPSALIGDANLPFDFLGRNAVASAGHEVHCKEPLGERRAGLVKDGTGRRIDVMAALLAGKRAPLRHRMKLGPINAAGRAGDLGAPVVDFHQLGEAGRVVRIFGLELFEGVF